MRIHRVDFEVLESRLLLDASSFLKVAPIDLPIDVDEMHGPPFETPQAHGPRFPEPPAHGRPDVTPRFEQPPAHGPRFEEPPAHGRRVDACLSDDSPDIDVDPMIPDTDPAIDTQPLDSERPPFETPQAHGPRFPEPPAHGRPDETPRFEQPPAHGPRFEEPPAYGRREDACPSDDLPDIDIDPMIPDTDPAIDTQPLDKDRPPFETPLAHGPRFPEPPAHGRPDETPRFEQPPAHGPRFAGDANGDGLFNRRDVVLVLQAGKYGTGRFATFDQGDWNGDGLFDAMDIVVAMQRGPYGQHPDH